MLLPSSLLTPVLLLLLCIYTADGKRIGLETYRPNCKEGSPQKQKDVRSCCHDFGITKPCRRLCSTNRHNHAFKGALSCSFTYQHIVDACHCGLEPLDPRPKHDRLKDVKDINNYKIEDKVTENSGAQIRKVNITIAAVRSGAYFLNQQVTEMFFVILPSLTFLFIH